MLKSCSYCGRIHDTRIVCAKQQEVIDSNRRKRKSTVAGDYRKKNAWTKKSRAIRERDKYLCLCCREMEKGTLIQYNTKRLSVHHIIPIVENPEMKNCDENLITVCERHHELCESGAISQEKQRKLVKKSMQEAENDGEFVAIL